MPIQTSPSFIILAALSMCCITAILIQSLGHKVTDKWWKLWLTLPALVFAWLLWLLFHPITDGACLASGFKRPFLPCDIDTGALATLLAALLATPAFIIPWMIHEANTRRETERLNRDIQTERDERIKLELMVKDQILSMDAHDRNKLRDQLQKGWHELEKLAAIAIPSFMHAPLNEEESAALPVLPSWPDWLHRLWQALEQIEPSDAFNHPQVIPPNFANRWTERAIKSFWGACRRTNGDLIALKNHIKPMINHPLEKWPRSHNVETIGKRLLVAINHMLQAAAYHDLLINVLDDPDQANRPPQPNSDMRLPKAIDQLDAQQRAEILARMHSIAASRYHNSIAGYSEGAVKLCT